MGLSAIILLRATLGVHGHHTWHGGPNNHTIIYHQVVWVRVRVETPLERC